MENPINLKSILEGCISALNALLGEVRKTAGSSINPYIARLLSEMNGDHTQVALKVLEGIMKLIRGICDDLKVQPFKTSQTTLSEILEELLEVLRGIQETMAGEHSTTRISHHPVEQYALLAQGNPGSAIFTALSIAANAIRGISG